ncbi:MarR family winged helix-turn-helix transcriptional regulator [Leifsonia sp. 2MCAF36]|uniref:MarR family winged helix-turn-helix transcriptional regulator n=1 Tax=Leifsonia sp. 2MCAF36 TaxID=3232988 RepID=UPI003F9A2E90
MSEEGRGELLRHIEALTLAIAIRSVPRMLQPLLATDLTIHQLKALTVVVTSEEGAATNELAATFSVSMASMSKLIDRLVEQGLVTRSTDTADQRIRRVTATELGRAAVRQLMGERPELGSDVLGGLSLSELRALETGLAGISRELAARGH